MAEAIAGALEGGLWAPDDSREGDLEPAVENGALRWEDAEGWETLGG